MFLLQGNKTKRAFLKYPFNVLLSIDFIFSNWLLMYLSDEELKAFAEKMLSWLRPGGLLFFRESCNHRSGTEPKIKLPHLPFILALI